MHSQRSTTLLLIFIFCTNTPNSAHEIEPTLKQACGASMMLGLTIGSLTEGLCNLKPPQLVENSYGPMIAQTSRNVSVAILLPNAKKFFTGERLTTREAVETFSFAASWLAAAYTVSYWQS